MPVRQSEACGLMTNIRMIKIHSWIKPIAVFTATWIAAAPTLALDSPVSDTGVTPIPVASEPMQQVFQTVPALPKPRPNPDLVYEIRPVAIALPQSKPALKDVLPTSTATLAVMIKAQTGLDISTEAVFKLRAGEGVGLILRRAGYTAADTAAAIEAAQAKASLRRLQIGTKFIIGEHGFQFSVKPGIDIYIVRNPEFGWLAIKALRPVETYVAFIQGVIDDSIYRAAKQAGVNEAAFHEYVRVMGFSVDFQREVRPGDQFEMMYETQRDSLSGQLISVKLRYAGLSLSGDQLGFYSFDGAENAIGWYDENGNSAARTLIRTPISGARLSSNFGSRKHPVSGYTAMHKGVDFAAPQGTPIIAAGSGVVRQAGWKGSFGRYIRIKHNATYDTAYAHMSRIAPHIAPGSRVKQGEIIGYVGSTGRSTGPHLHYEILANNRQVNPMTVRLPTGKQIDPVDLDDFKQQVQMVEAEVLARGTQRFAAALSTQLTH